MKLFDKKIEGPNIELIVIPRGGDKQDIVLQAAAIMDFTPFEQTCPEPKPPMKILKGGAREYNLEDVGYKQALSRWGDQKVAWMVIESLKATPGLEWETIVPSNPKTWLLYIDELKASGFSLIEIQRITNGVFAANCLNEQRVEEARKNFLRGPQDQLVDTSGPSTEQPSTSSGKPASDSESNPQESTQTAGTT